MERGGIWRPTTKLSKAFLINGFQGKGRYVHGRLVSRWPKKDIDHRVVQSNEIWPNAYQGEVLPVPVLYLYARGVQGWS